MTPERVAELRALVETGHPLLKCDGCGAIYWDDHAALTDSCHDSECGRFMQRMEWAKADAIVTDLRALLAERERGWSAELPTVSGWYWQKQGTSEPEVVEVCQGKVWMSGEDYSVDLSLFEGCLWSGPLTPPKQAGAQTP